MASHPLIRASVSCGTTNVSALILRLLLPPRGCDLLLVLPPIAEAMRALLLRLFLGDLLLQPGAIALGVLHPHLVLTGIVGERRLVDHRDTLLDGAYGLAHTAAAAGRHIGVVQVLRGDVEAGVGALQPTQSALHAFVEIDHRTHRAGRVLL